jgi:hypothetical protein
MSDPVQWAIIAFIVIVLLYLVWRGGAANPESTGSLDRKVNVLSGQVSALSTRVGHVETGMKKLQDDGASTKDITLLRELIDERLKSQKELSEATNRNVQRIYDIMLEKGLGK